MTDPNRLPAGSLVQYYLEGWRVGRLEELKGLRARIRPLAAYKGTVPRCHWVPATDVKPLSKDK